MREPRTDMEKLVARRTYLVGVMEELYDVVADYLPDFDLSGDELARLTAYRMYVKEWQDISKEIIRLKYSGKREKTNDRTSKIGN